MVSSYDTTASEALLRAAGQGDRAALRRRVERHRDYPRRVIDLRMDQDLRGRAGLSDTLQEAQIVAGKRINEFEKGRPTSFKLWMRGEAMQQLAAHYRRHVDAARLSVQRECSISDASSLMLAKGAPSSGPRNA